jgi:hypothetical protein
MSDPIVDVVMLLCVALFAMAVRDLIIIVRRMRAKKERANERPNRAIRNRHPR